MLLLGEAIQHATWHSGQSQAHGPEGMMHLGIAHGHPPNVPDPKSRGSTISEQAIVAPKAAVCATPARRPVVDEGERTRPDPWPSPGTVTADSDVYTRTSVLLEGEQKHVLPFEGSEQHAAPCTPQLFSSSSFLVVPPPPVAVARDVLHGKRRATDLEGRADPYPEVLKPPDCAAEDLDESGGASSVPGDLPVVPGDLGTLGLADAIVNTRTEAREPARVVAQEPGGALSAVKAEPNPTEDTAGIEPVGAAERAAAAESEALEPWAEGKGRHGLDTAPQDDTAAARRGPDTAPQGHSTKGKQVLEALPPQGDVGTRGHGRDTTPPGNPIEGGPAHGAARRSDSTEGKRKFEALPKGFPVGRDTSHGHERATERDLPTREGARVRNPAWRPDPNKRAFGAQPQGATTAGERKCVPREHVGEGEQELEPPLRGASIERGRERTRLPRKPPLEGAPTAVGTEGTCQPRRKPPWEATHDPTRPIEARRASARGTIDCPTSPTWPLENFVSLATSTMKQATYLCLWSLLPRITGRHRRRRRFEAERWPIESERTRGRCTRGLYRGRHMLSHAASCATRLEHAGHTLSKTSNKT